MSKPRFDLVIGEEALLMKSCLFSSIKVIHMQWLDDQIPLVRTFRPKVDRSSQSISPEVCNFLSSGETSLV